MEKSYRAMSRRRAKTSRRKVSKQRSMARAAVSGWRQRGVSNRSAVVEVAKELHFDEPKVRALERNDFEVLGAPVFAKGHLRKYAQLVGVDEDGCFRRLLYDDELGWYAANRGRGARKFARKCRRVPGSQRLSYCWLRQRQLLVVCRTTCRRHCCAARNTGPLQSRSCSAEAEVTLSRAGTARGTGDTNEPDAGRGADEQKNCRRLLPRGITRAGGRRVATNCNWADSADAEFQWRVLDRNQCEPMASRCFSRMGTSGRIGRVDRQGTRNGIVWQCRQCQLKYWSMTTPIH